MNTFLIIMSVLLVVPLSAGTIELLSASRIDRQLRRKPLQKYLASCHSASDYFAAAESELERNRRLERIFPADDHNKTWLEQICSNQIIDSLLNLAVTADSSYSNPAIAVRLELELINFDCHRTTADLFKGSDKERALIITALSRNDTLLTQLGDTLLNLYNQTCHNQFDSLLEQTFTIHLATGKTIAQLWRTAVVPEGVTKEEGKKYRSELESRAKAISLSSKKVVSQQRRELQHCSESCK